MPCTNRHAPVEGIGAARRLCLLGRLLFLARPARAARREFLTPAREICHEPAGLSKTGLRTEKLLSPQRAYAMGASPTQCKAPRRTSGRGGYGDGCAPAFAIAPMTASRYFCCICVTGETDGPPSGSADDHRPFAWAADFSIGTSAPTEPGRLWTIAARISDFATG